MAGTVRAAGTTRALPHPRNTLNELSGEEWLYFTKSLWTTAYPSELGHALRKQHGANKPPRLMARLIEFFTKTGELVLDPFAGVGGTLLGAAIARGPRRALGIELAPRWAEIYEQVVADARVERDGGGPGLADLGTSDPGGPRSFDPSGCELRVGDALAILPTLAAECIDFVATDPPYNVQLPMTMSGGVLSESFANRRTDYAMVTEDPADLANAPDYPAFLDRMTEVLAHVERVLRPNRYAVLIVRDAYQGGRYLFTGADLAARAASVGLTPKGDLIWYQAGSRLRPYGYPTGFVPNIAHQHLLVLRRDSNRDAMRPTVVKAVARHATKAGARADAKAGTTAGAKSGARAGVKPGQAPDVARRAVVAGASTTRRLDTRVGPRLSRPA